MSSTRDRTTTTRVMTPAGLPGLIETLALSTPQSRLLAGGTDLVRQMTQEHLTPDLIIDLSGVAELHGIRAAAGCLRIGATATFAEIAADPLVRRHARCLAEAAGVVGAVQTRNMATIGGNVGNASPCADSVPALLALDASALVINGQGEKTERRVDGIVAGPGTTTLRHDEAIIELVVPLLDESYRSTYAKLGSRTMVSVARIGMAVVVRLVLDAGDTSAPAAIDEARVGIGALGETAFRAPTLEQVLAGRPADRATRHEFIDACPAVAQSSIPGRYSLPYKQEAIRGVADDAWTALGLDA